MPPVVWVTQYYKCASASRQRELDDTLLANLNNTNIDAVLVLLEREQDLPPITHEKMIMQNLGRRMTFADAFRVCNDHWQGWVCALSNGDIIFDEGDTAKLRKLPARMALMLSRYELLEKKGALRSRSTKPRPFHTLDSWCFVAPLPEALVRRCDFTLGYPNCDYRLAYLFHRAGLLLCNAWGDVRTYHNHASAIREQGLLSSHGLWGMGAHVLKSPRVGVPSTVLVRPLAPPLHTICIVILMAAILVLGLGLLLRNKL